MTAKMSIETNTSNNVDLSKIDRPWQYRLLTPLFTLLIGALLYWGWLNRDEYMVTAEWGLGYGLGLTGGVLFLLIFLYPLRKKWRLLREAGPVKLWFNIHMIMGISAPVFILFHANFQLGSTNSNVALYSMLLVVASGIIGRYIYVQIHYGLYGSQAKLEELEAITSVTRGQLGTAFGVAPVVAEKLSEFEVLATKPAKGLLEIIGRKLFIGITTWKTYFVLRSRLRKPLERKARLQGWSKQQQRRFYHDSCHTIAIHLSAIRKIAVLSFYERLFASWHMIHVVFFTMLVISGLVHVLAVHMY
jgi:hypothetical protein